MMALNDRLKLHSMVAATKGDMVYVASEECAIRRIEPEPDTIWAPKRRGTGHCNAQGKRRKTGAGKAGDINCLPV